MAELLELNDPRLPLRFWNKVEAAPNGCWLWRGALNPRGYGHMIVGSRRDGSRRYVAVHRFAYLALVGPITAPQLDHVCRNHNCVYPVHLEPVTAKVNLARGAGHGHETHCPRGHPYDETNTYVHGDKRYCRTCNRERYTPRGKHRVPLL